MLTIQRAKAEAIEFKGEQGGMGKNSDNTERKGRRYRIRGGAERGGSPTIKEGKASAIVFKGEERGESPTIQRGKAEANEFKRQQREEDCRQYRKERQRP